MNRVCESGESVNHCAERAMAQQEQFMQSLEQRYGPFPRPDYSDNLDVLGVIVFFVVVLFLFWRI